MLAFVGRLWSRLFLRDASLLQILITGFIWFVIGAIFLGHALGAW